MVELVAGPVAWLFAFPAAPPREPLRKGLAEGGVLVLSNLTIRPRKKLIS
jgi:hypothetical protein